MNWHTSSQDDIHIVRLSGRFDAHTAPAIKRRLTEIATGPRPRILVQLGDVHFIDSPALGALTVALRQARSNGGELVLSELSQPVRITFELTQLDRIFPIAATDEGALSRLNGIREGASHD
jgi:anti-sigma B factor antagonist